MSLSRLGIVAVVVALFVVVSLILSAFFCIPWSMADDPKPEALQPRKRIDNANAYYVKAWKTGDAEMFANNFAKKGALFEEGGKVVLGYDAIREHMNGTFSRMRMKEGSIRTTGLWFADGCAWETGKWVFAIGSVTELGNAKPDSGYYLKIWLPEDGYWKIWRDLRMPRG